MNGNPGDILHVIFTFSSGRIPEFSHNFLFTLASLKSGLNVVVNRVGLLYTQDYKGQTLKFMYFYV